MTGTCFVCGRQRQTVVTALGPNCFVCADETGCHPHTREIYLHGDFDPDNPPVTVDPAEPMPATITGGPDVPEVPSP